RVDLLNGLLAALASAKTGAKRDDGELAALLREAAKAEGALPAPRRGLAMADGTGVDERVHVRGSPKALGPGAPRRLRVVLAGEKRPAPTSGSGRLEMARRLTHPSNPLLARVIVNRLWQHHFGTGIVASPDDFGFQGERPTHPEL